MQSLGSDRCLHSDPPSTARRAGSPSPAARCGSPPSCTGSRKLSHPTPARRRPARPSGAGCGTAGAASTWRPCATPSASSATVPETRNASSSSAASAAACPNRETTELGSGPGRRGVRSSASSPRHQPSSRLTDDRVFAAVRLASPILFPDILSIVAARLCVVGSFMPPKCPSAPRRLQRHLRRRLTRNPPLLSANPHSPIRPWNTPLRRARLSGPNRTARHIRPVASTTEPFDP